MKKKKTERFNIYDKYRNQIASYLPTELPIMKEVIVEKSIYFFDDANPCFIHENAVLVRMIEEIKICFKDVNEAILIKSLPEEIKYYLNIGKEGIFMEYCSDK